MEFDSVKTEKLVKPTIDKAPSEKSKDVSNPSNKNESEVISKLKELFDVEEYKFN